MSKNNSNGKDLLLGAVVGGVLGAVTALLFAPKSGSELRSDISEQVKQVNEKTQALAASASQKTQQIAKTVGSQTNEWVDKVKDVVGNVTEEVKAWRDSRKEDVSAEGTPSEAAEALETTERVKVEV